MVDIVKDLALLKQFEAELDGEFNSENRISIAFSVLELWAI